MVCHGALMPGEPLEPAVKVPQIVDNPHARPDRLVSSSIAAAEHGGRVAPAETLPPPCDRVARSIAATELGVESVSRIQCDLPSQERSGGESEIGQLRSAC